MPRQERFCPLITLGDEAYQGQHVIIKSAGELEGIIVEEIFSDPSVADNKRTYHVSIPATEKRYNASHLEAIPTNEGLRPYSPEWNEEWAHWMAAGQRILTHPDDTIARSKFIESGHKLGTMVHLPRKE